MPGFFRPFFRQFYRTFPNKFPTPVDAPHDLDLITPYEVSKAATPVAVTVEGAGFAAGDLVNLDGVAQTTSAPAADGKTMGASLALGTLGLGYHEITVSDIVTGAISNKLSVFVNA